MRILPVFLVVVLAALLTWAGIIYFATKIVRLAWMGY